MNAPSIKGTYQLVRRELPDGQIQYPPLLKGMMTLTNGIRNFSVVWQDDKGKYYSECYVARYLLTEEEYSETAEYLIVDNEIEGSGIRYDLSPVTATSPVTREGERLIFALPQQFERELNITVEFNDSGFKATAKDLFVDFWERVPD